jgi:hypothetical protein
MLCLSDIFSSCILNSKPWSEYIYSLRYTNII